MVGCLAGHTRQVARVCCGGTLIDMKPKSGTPQAPIQTGQVWRMADSNIQITLIGRTLVHFKRGAPGAKRVSTSLLNKAALEQFLIKNKAVLVQP